MVFKDTRILCYIEGVRFHLNKIDILQNMGKVPIAIMEFVDQKAIRNIPEMSIVEIFEYQGIVNNKHSARILFTGEIKTNTKRVSLSSESITIYAEGVLSVFNNIPQQYFKNLLSTGRDGLIYIPNKEYEFLQINRGNVNKDAIAWDSPVRMLANPLFRGTLWEGYVQLIHHSFLAYTFTDYISGYENTMSEFVKRYNKQYKIVYHHYYSKTLMAKNGIMHHQAFMNYFYNEIDKMDQIAAYTTFDTIMSCYAKNDLIFQEIPNPPAFTNAVYGKDKDNKEQVARITTLHKYILKDNMMFMAPPACNLIIVDNSIKFFEVNIEEPKVTRYMLKYNVAERSVPLFYSIIHNEVVIQYKDMVAKAKAKKPPIEASDLEKRIGIKAISESIDATEVGLYREDLERDKGFMTNERTVVTIPGKELTEAEIKVLKDNKEDPKNDPNLTQLIQEYKYGDAIAKQKYQRINSSSNSIRLSLPYLNTSFIVGYPCMVYNKDTKDKYWGMVESISWTYNQEQAYAETTIMISNARIFKSIYNIGVISPSYYSCKARITDTNGKVLKEECYPFKDLLSSEGKYQYKTAIDDIYNNEIGCSSVIDLFKDDYNLKDEIAPIELTRSIATMSDYLNAKYIEGELSNSGVEPGTLNISPISKISRVKNIDEDIILSKDLTLFSQESNPDIIVDIENPFLKADELKDMWGFKQNPKDVWIN